MDTGRLRSVAMIAIFDIGGPLLAYHLLQSNGFSTVAALVLSGLFPAAGMIIGFIGHRRVDAVGVLVLAGIVVGAILGLVSHNPKLVLDEGSVSTGVFGLICLGSLATDKPMMYRFALEFIGPDTEQGREFIDLRQYKEFRRAFVVITVVWGSSYVAEAAARVFIVQDTSAGIALAVSKVLPYAVAGVLIAWTVGYSRYQRRRGERLAAAYAAAAEAAAQTDAGDAHHGLRRRPPRHAGSGMRRWRYGTANAGPAVHRGDRRPEGPGRRRRLEHPRPEPGLPGLHRGQPLA